MKRPLSNDTIDSVLRQRDVSRAKDLSAPRRAVFIEDPQIQVLIWQA